MEGCATLGVFELANVHSNAQLITGLIVCIENLISF